jgi:hypothetical protein
MARKPVSRPKYGAPAHRVMLQRTSSQIDVTVLNLQRKCVRLDIDRFHCPSLPIIHSRQTARISLIKGQSIAERVVRRVESDRGGQIF